MATSVRAHIEFAAMAPLLPRCSAGIRARDMTGAGPRMAV